MNRNWSLRKMSTLFSRLLLVWLVASTVHFRAAESVPRVSVEDEKRINVKTAKEVDEYVKLYASDTGPAPNIVCSINTITVDDCEEYFQEVEMFINTTRQIISNGVVDIPMSLFAPSRKDSYNNVEIEIQP